MLVYIFCWSFCSVCHPCWCLSPSALSFDHLMPLRGQSSGCCVADTDGRLCRVSRYCFHIRQLFLLSALLYLDPSLHGGHTKQNTEYTKGNCQSEKKTLSESKGWWNLPASRRMRRADCSSTLRELIISDVGCQCRWKGRTSPACCKFSASVVKWKWLFQGCGKDNRKKLIYCNYEINVNGKVNYF